MRRKIDRTPGRLVVGALICLYGGFLLVMAGLVIGALVAPDLGRAVTALGWLALVAVKFLLLAAIFACFDQTPLEKDGT
jgi:hypothetical protein